jgi:hypothetical protein
MAKAKKEDVAQAGEKPAAVVASYVLTRNHGLRFNGLASAFYAAGTSFDADRDKDVILALIRSGASLEDASAQTDTE